ncbi:MAG: SIR2 family protein [Plesiomonas shigelloides]
MTLPHPLIERVKSGRVVLFLGSGALFGAKLPNDKKIPLGNDLRDVLNERFLNGEFSGESLSVVSEMAISAYSLSEIQTYIAEYFSGIIPANFHFEIPKFKWATIFTTNYDRLVETCYEKSTDARQKLVPFLSDEQDIESHSISPGELPLIKLHGCITRTHDEGLPLILTIDQYNQYKKNRAGLFKYLFETAYKNTIVFVGHSLQDANIRSVLKELETEAPNGERHYLLKPGLKDVERDFWGQKKITALDMTFENFICDLNLKISPDDRVLSRFISTDSHYIQQFFNTNIPPSEELITSAERDFTVLHNTMSVNACVAKNFFKGVEQEWSPVVDKVAITRSIQSIIYNSVIMKPDAERKLKTEFYVVKGEAGSGKSVLLRQLAWETMQSKIGVSIWVNSGRPLDIDLIEELSSKSGERLFIFWDDAANNAIEINRFVSKAVRRDMKITIISAERYNEWNIRCEELDEQITDKFSLRYLSEKEIEALVDSLELHDSLGPILVNKSREERCSELRDRHGRQLLVALHEATMGEPFEDIIFNEYSNIIPERAKRIYLTVCALNRLKVPVRAGLIARVHEITFEDFKSNFYFPLENVVISKTYGNDDIFYAARHSEIAEIVFKRALEKPEDKYFEYISILSKLNISFSSDRDSYRLLIKARSLQDLFPDLADVAAIYKHAHSVFGDDPYLLQQMANYERLRTNGSIDKAIDLLVKASDSAPNDSSILHSLAVCWRDKAERAKDLSHLSLAIGEARGYLQKIIHKWGDSSYVSSTLIELSIINLKSLLNDDSSPIKLINESIRKVQQELTDNKQKFPSSGHIYKLEAQFSELINDNANALRALQRSFEENDREPYLAIRLAEIYLVMSKLDDAKKVLEMALERRRSDHSLNFHYAELLRIYSKPEQSELIYFYRRAFTPKDRNYHAQFWFARFSFFSPDSKYHNKSIEIFDHIRNGRFSFEVRHEVRDYDGGNKNPRVHNGTISRKREAFGFLIMDGTGYEIFVPAKQVKDDLWNAIEEGDRVSFNIAFSFSGPFAANLIPV